VRYYVEEFFVNARLADAVKSAKVRFQQFINVLVRVWLNIHI